MSFPNPTWAEVIISFKLFVLLYIPKKALDLVLEPLFNREIRALKRAVYKHHMRHHRSSLRSCTEDICKLKLQSRQPSQAHLSSPELAAVLPELEA
jgi:hypothetical protein